MDQEYCDECDTENVILFECVGALLCKDCSDNQTDNNPIFDDDDDNYWTEV